MDVIQQRFFPDVLLAGTAALPEAHYDMQSVYAHQLGNLNQRYLMSKDEVLAEMDIWLKSPEVRCA